MSHLWLEGVPIEVFTSQALWPTRLIWERRLHPVLRVEDYWLADFGWWRSDTRVARDYFLLTTTTGLLLEVFHNLITDAWYLQRLYD